MKTSLTRFNTWLKDAAQRLIAFSNTLYDALMVLRQTWKRRENTLWKRIDQMFLWALVILVALAILGQIFPSLRVKADSSPPPVASPTADPSPTTNVSPTAAISPTLAMSPTPQNESGRPVVLSAGKIQGSNSVVVPQNGADNPVPTPAIATNINFTTEFGLYKLGSGCLNLPNGQTLEDQAYPTPTSNSTSAQTKFSEIPPCPDDNLKFQALRDDIIKNCKPNATMTPVDTVGEQTSNINEINTCISNDSKEMDAKCDTAYSDPNSTVLANAKTICHAGYKYGFDYATCLASYDQSWFIQLKSTTTTTTSSNGSSAGGSTTTTTDGHQYPTDNLIGQFNTCTTGGKSTYVTSVQTAIPYCTFIYDSTFKQVCTENTLLSANPSIDDIIVSTPANWSYDSVDINLILPRMEGVGLGLLFISIIYLGYIFLVGGVFLNDGGSFNGKQYILVLVVAAVAIAEAPLLMQIMITLSDAIIKLLTTAFGFTDQNLRDYVDISYPQLPGLNLLNFGSTLIELCMAMTKWIMKIVIAIMMGYRLMMIDICLIFAPIAFFFLTIPQAKRWYTFWINMFFANLFTQPAMMACMLMAMEVSKWASQATNDGNAAWDDVLELMGLFIAIKMFSLVANMFDHSHFMDIGAAGLAAVKAVATAPLKGVQMATRMGGRYLNQKYGFEKQMTKLTEKNKQKGQDAADPARVAKRFDDTAKAYNANQISAKQVRRANLSRAQQRAILDARSVAAGGAGENAPISGNFRGGFGSRTPVANRAIFMSNDNNNNNNGPLRSALRGPLQHLPGANRGQGVRLPSNLPRHALPPTDQRGVPLGYNTGPGPTAPPPPVVRRGPPQPVGPQQPLAQQLQQARQRLGLPPVAVGGPPRVPNNNPFLQPPNNNPVAPPPPQNQPPPAYSSQFRPGPANVQPEDDFAQQPHRAVPAYAPDAATGEQTLLRGDQPPDYVSPLDEPVPPGGRPPLQPTPPDGQAR